MADNDYPDWLPDWLKGMPGQTPQLPTAMQAVTTPTSPFQNQNVSPYLAPSWLQGLWATVPGRMAQGAIVDPLLGAPQLMSHLLATADPRLSGLSAMMDNAVNSVEKSYGTARAAAGQNPNDSDWARTAGAIAGGLIPGADILEGPEVLGKLGSRMVSGAANNVLTAPVDTSNGQSYVTGKAKAARTGAATGPASDYLSDALRFFRGV